MKRPIFQQFSWHSTLENFIKNGAPHKNITPEETVLTAKSAEIRNYKMIIIMMLKDMPFADAPHVLSK
ncbi:hypothetical protein [Phaeovulum vinaykumarii]|uniref:hypothetical protein n=1 Tax=Phaeovulum vinaykumarii TaxID=407234 RepID=UPI001AECB03C|nr:hypothetical protein [Phaeovulum vinaykumarii]